MMDKGTSTLLPNGSVIRLKEGTKKLVIYGRKQMLMTEPPVNLIILAVYTLRVTLIRIIRMYSITKILKRSFSEDMWIRRRKHSRRNWSVSNPSCKGWFYI